MSIASEIERLSGVRSDIFTSITNKGVTVPVGSTFSSCPSLIDSIVTGGGGGDPTSLINPTFTASAYWSAYMPFTATQKPVAVPEYYEWEAYSGAPYQGQQTFFTIFELQDKLLTMANRYGAYNLPSYFILTMSASASNPNSQMDNLYYNFMSDSFFNNSNIWVIGNNQNSYIIDGNYTSTKQGIREVDPSQPYAPTAIYLSSIVDLSPIFTNPSIYSQATPSSTVYGNGFSISFNRTNEIQQQWPQWITQLGGSIASSISGCLDMTTAYPYPTYQTTTTGYITNEISGRESFTGSTTKVPNIYVSGFKNVVYEDSPEGGATAISPVNMNLTSFSSNMLKNNITAKTNYALNSTAYSYDYGTAQTAYSGFEGV